MIIGDLDRPATFTYIPSPLKEVCQYLAILDLTTLELGKHQLNDDIWFNVAEVELELAENRKAEIHHNHIDIQVPISGLEGYDFDLGDPELNNNSYNSRDDYQLMELACSQHIQLQPRQFVIFMPYEIHKPCCNYGDHQLTTTIKKLVVKIPVQLLN